MHHPLRSFPSERLQRLRSEATAGLFVVSASPLAAEACATRSLDWLVFDQEASPVGRDVLTHMLLTLNGSGVLGFARVADKVPQQIEAALDAGCHGVIVPRISTPEDAMAVVRAARYPPIGRRGVNPIRCSAYFASLPEYLCHANEDIVVGVQIETAAALRNVDAIAAVEGVDLLFVGCGDLSAELGCLGQVDHPVMAEAIEAILEASLRHRKIPGIFAYSLDLSRRYRELGYQFIAIGNELKLMLQAVEEGFAEHWRPLTGAGR